MAKMSANFGADDHRLRELTMKPEFYFPVFAVANATKTYYSSIAIQEGNVFSDVKREIKGGHLKPSNSTKEIVKDAEAMMIDIMDTILRDGKCSMGKYLKWVADLEEKISNELVSGESDYFKFSKIKAKDAYKNDNSPYLRHLMWEEVFAPKYGTAGDPPYLCIKVSLEVNNKTELLAWLGGIKDSGMKSRLENYFTISGKKDFSTIYIPYDILLSTGKIPDELLPIMDISKIVRNLMGSHYLILGSLGFELNNKKYLLKDQLSISR
jgi:hypothetical protein